MNSFWSIKKIKKSINIFFITLLVLLILLFLSIYISSLNSFRKSDFNIPENFFQTKFWDREPYSDENWFLDFIDFIDYLNEKDFEYTDILSKCTFDIEYVENWKCDKEKAEYINKLKDDAIQKYLINYYFDINEKQILTNIRDINYYKNKIIIDDYESYIKLSEKIFNLIQEKNPKSKISKEFIDKYIEAWNYFESIKLNILNKEYLKTRDLINITSFKYKNIYNKEYILQTPEYSNIYEWKENKNVHKTIVYYNLLKYSRSIRYVAYDYFEKWNFSKWINIILDFQKFIDNLINKSDSDLKSFLIYFTMYKINLESINYFVSNYHIPDNLKNEIKITLELTIDDSIVKNSLIYDHLEYSSRFQYLYDIYFDKYNYKYNWNIFLYIKWVLEWYLFFSVDETVLISDKIKYDIINSKWKDSDYFKCDVNINNFIWRKIICETYSPINYSNIFDKGKNLLEIRKNILDKLN